MEWILAGFREIQESGIGEFMRPLGEKKEKTRGNHFIIGDNPRSLRSLIPDT
jgi:hypothetical protein